MSSSELPSYEELKRRLDAAESGLKAMRTFNQLIVTEHDPRRLIERACANLIESMGYYNAWIALLGGEAARSLELPEAGPVSATAASGFDGGFEILRERLERGEFPECMKRALETGDTLMERDPAADCAGQPLHVEYGSRAGLVQRLDAGGVTYGILTACVPAAYARDAEQRDLFSRMAGDLAFALHKIATARELEESRRSYREIFENSRDGFVMVDGAGKILDANDAYCAMLGYTLDELKAMPDFYAITPKRWHAWENEEIWQKRLLSQGCSGLYEKEYIRKDGTVFPVELRSYVVRRENGEIDYLWGTARDITERRQAEDNLHQEREQLLSIFNSIDAVIYISDPTTHEMLYANRFIQEQLPTDYLGAKCYKVLQNRDGPCPFCTNDIILKQKPKAYQWEFHNKNFDRHYAISDRIIRWPDGRDVRFEIAIDITERKRVEEALRESEQRLQAVFNAVDSVAIQGYDKNRLVFFWNPASEKFYGYTHDEAIGRPLEQLIIPEESRESVVEAIRQSHEKGVPIPAGEIELLHKNGDRLQIYSNHVMITNHRGDKEMFCIDVDLTEIRRIERRMTSLSAVVENSDDIVVVKDLDLRVVATNPAFAKAAGHAAVDAMIGKTDAEIFGVTPDTEPIHSYMQDERRAQTLPPGEYILREEPLVTPDGEVRTVLTKKYPIYDPWGNLLGTGNISTDITERKQAEERQQNLATELEQILDSLPDAVVYADTERRIKKVNPSFTRIFGYTQDEVLGKKTRIIYRNDEEYRDQGRKRYNPQAPQMWEPYEIYHVRKDGTEFISETVGTPVRDAQGKVVGLLGLIQDVTDRKLIEIEKQNLQAQLQQAQKMEAVGRLAGGVAHDFNNMLGIIIGHADMILEEMSPDQPFYANLMEIRNAGARSADLTRQLLAFARKQLVSPKVIDLNKTVEGMLKMLQRLIGEDIDIAWMRKEKVWAIKIDPGQVAQILVNLCVNARDAITDVGKVTIETDNLVFDEDYCRAHAGYVPGEYAMLAVSDDGCGMDSETLSRLFEPFFTTKELGKGTGLGLATVYGVVKQNNGFIHVYSEPGLGTTFKIYLPRHLAKSTRFPEDRANQPIQGGQETVLLVEDEPAILRITTMMLEREGYTVLGAGTPGEAVRLATEHAGEIHLLMTDVVMPEMNGRDLAKNILSLYPGLKCLFMSGYTANVIAHHGVLDEGVNFMQKPFSKEDLAVKVREALES